ncbi:MAG: ABC transporter permease, partial [Gemmatimonadetes bacterium]|nr:ABC transporter permease [Gemmatimonadota bacterium]
FGIAAFPIAHHAGPVEATTLSAGGRSAGVGRERQRLRSGLVVAQVALALTLVVGAGLLVASLRRLQAVQPGIQTDGVLTMQLHLTGERYGSDVAMWRFYALTLERIRSLPGVEAAGMSQEIPFSGGYGCTVQGFEDQAVYGRLRDAEMTTCAGQEPTTPGYFDAMGIPLLQGRVFTEADNDHPDRGVVVVSRAVADRFWPGEDPIGKGIAPSGRTSGPFYRVVGVVGDVYRTSLGEELATAVYYPVVRIPESGGWWPTDMYLTVRTANADPMSVFAAIRRAVVEVEPTVPLANAREMESIIDDSMSRLTFTGVLLEVAAAVALLLASVGLYGVMSYVVSRRTREIGMRMALGARPDQVERLIVGKSFGLVAMGLSLGVFMALALTRVMRGLLFGVEPTHPVAFVTAICLLAAVALVASWLPARRAARIDPAVALRME